MCAADVQLTVVNLLRRSRDDDIWVGLLARKHVQLPSADAWFKMVLSADLNTRSQQARRACRPHPTTQPGCDSICNKRSVSCLMPQPRSSRCSYTRSDPQRILARSCRHRPRKGSHRADAWAGPPEYIDCVREQKEGNAHLRLSKAIYNFTDTQDLRLAVGYRATVDEKGVVTGVRMSIGRPASRGLWALYVALVDSVLGSYCIASSRQRPARSGYVQGRDNGDMQSGAITPSISTDLCTRGERYAHQQPCHLDMRARAGKCVIYKVWCC